MGWIRVSKWNKYNAYQHTGQVEALTIQPSQFANGLPFTNPVVVSSVSNLYYVREGIFDNRVVKNSNDNFTLTKFTTDIGYQTINAPLLYLVVNAVQSTANYKFNLNMQGNQNIVMLRVYLSQCMGALHALVGSPHNKPPIELGFKIYNNSNYTYMNISSRGQWDTFNVTPYYDSRLAKYNEEAIYEIRCKTFEMKNLNTYPTQTLTFEAYPVSIPSNFGINDNFVSWVSCRVDVYSKGQHLIPDLNQLFIYENN